MEHTSPPPEASGTRPGNPDDVIEQNPYAPPGVPVLVAEASAPSSTAPMELEGAGFWIRALARLIDLAFHYVTAFAAMIVVVVILAIYASTKGLDLQVLIAKLGPFSILSAFLSILGSWAMHALCEGLHGSTLGKRLCGLAVISEGGHPCSFKQGLGRSAAFYIDSLFFGLVAASQMSDSPKRQRLGDKWCHTIVARRSALPPSAVRGWGRFFAVFATAFLVDTALIAVGLLQKAVA